MALRGMTIEEMIAVSAGWIDPKDEARRRIEKAPRLVGLLPDLTTAHTGILAVGPSSDDAVAEIVRLAGQVDATHDLLARGIYGLLTALALLDDNGEELLTLRDQLFANGLAGAVNATYRGQAGYAALLRERLTPALREQLQGIRLRSGTLLDRVEAWLAAADELGELERRRARLETLQSPSVKLQILEARNQWIRVVNAFQSIAQLAQLDEETDRLLFGPLRDAEQTADRRAARRRSGSGRQAEEPRESEEPQVPEADQPVQAD